VKLRVRTVFKVFGHFYFLGQNDPRRNKNFTPQDLKSGTVSEVSSFTVTAASVEYFCCHKTSELLFVVVTAQVTLPARKHLSSQTWKSTL